MKHEQYNAKRIQTTPKHLTLDLFNTGCWRAGTVCACPPCLPNSETGGGSQWREAFILTIDGGRLLRYSLSVSYRKAYIPSQRSSRLRDCRSEPSLHKQAGRCRLDNPALTAGSGYRQLRFQQRCSQWKSGFHRQKSIPRRLCLC